MGTLMTGAPAAAPGEIPRRLVGGSSVLLSGWNEQIMTLSMPANYENAKVCPGWTSLALVVVSAHHEGPSWPV